MPGVAAMIVQPKLMPVSTAELRLGATYVAPSGRLCRLAPPHRRGGAVSDGETFVFEYLDAHSGGTAAARQQGAALERDNFILARTNVGVLREVRR